MKVISTDTREDAWLKAVEHLDSHAEQHIEYNLILEVKKPVLTTEQSLNIRKKFDAFLKSNELYSVQTVADTIFPAALYKKYGLQGLYDIYPNTIYPSLRNFSVNQRGTYAMRLLRSKDSSGKDYNPLAYVIERLKNTVLNKGTRCSTEVSLDECQSIPINRNDKNLLAFPCLSHLSFKLSLDRTELHLTAIYRSQYFIEKAMGNLLGLARLQDCICREVGVKPGVLVCHATYAKLDNTSRVRAFRKLIESLKN